VGLITLTPHQVIAGDVDASGTPTHLDASYVLQYAVGLIPLRSRAQSGVGVLAALPQLLPLNLNQNGQDFAGILIGDVTGNWGESSSKTLGICNGGGSDALLCDGPTPWVSPSRRSSGYELYAVELTVAFDPAVISVDAARAARHLGWSVVSNQPTPGPCASPWPAPSR